MLSSQVENLHTIRAGCVNVNSLFNKVNFVNDLLISEKLVALGICETWLVNEISSSFV